MEKIIYLEKEYECFDCRFTVKIKKSTLMKTKKKGFTGVYCPKCGKQIKQNEKKQNYM